MATQIFKDCWAFTEREDKKVNGVSQEFADDHKNYEEDNTDNEGCWN